MNLRKILKRIRNYFRVKMKPICLEDIKRRAIIKIAPIEELTVSSWANAYRILSPESSSESGRWRTSRAPYQKGMMDAVNEGESRR